MTRIVFATDVHGSERCFLKFTNSWKVFDANVLILGGDITGKMVVFIVEMPDGKYKTTYLGSEMTLKNMDKVKELEKNISDSGFYPYVTTKAKAEKICAKKPEQDKLIERLMRERMEKWMRIAEERLSGKGIKCYITGGNDDPAFVDKILAKSSLVVDPENKVVEIDKDHEMISSGFSNMTPWSCPRDVSEEELEKKIKSMASKVKNLSNCVFNFHCPPYNSSLDTAPKLTKDLKFVIIGGKQVMIPVGSTAVKSAIEKYQPLLGLHGHIHEGKGIVHIGRTLCINPGAEYQEGILRAAIVDLDKDKIKNFQLISG